MGIKKLSTTTKNTETCARGWGQQLKRFWMSRHKVIRRRAFDCANADQNIRETWSDAMTVDRSCVFKVTIYVCVSCLFISCLFYFSIQPFQSIPDSYGTKMPIHVKTLESNEVVRKGLYARSKLVDELNEHTYKFVKDGKVPSVILYYASWCGHCRSFVPTYESVANTTVSRIAQLNKEHTKTNRGRRGYNNKPYTNLHFTALDCAEYSSICSKERINSYPTMTMQNVNGTTEMISGPSPKSATKFINEKYFRVQDQELNMLNGPKIGTAVPTYVSKPLKLSYEATAEQRFEDALMSLDYMLLREIPREWSMNHTSSLLSFLRIFTHVFPTELPHAAATMKVYQTLIEIVENDLSSPGKFLSDKIINHISKQRPQSPKWKVCGVLSSAPLGISTQTSNVRASAAHSRAHYLRHSRMLKKAAPSSGSGGGDSIVSYGADGYPCGLWFLFHYLSVASGDPRYGFRHTAEEVLRSIYDLAKHFFACYDCREHFMRAYDDCTFDRCSIGERNYDLMQLWLFHQHNAVTQRVWAEETNSGSTSSTNYSADTSSSTGSATKGENNDVSTDFLQQVALRKELWPSTNQCSTCIDMHTTSSTGVSSLKEPYIMNTTAILQYLHTAYAI